MEFFSLNGNRRLCEKCLCAMNIMFKSIFKPLLMKHPPLNKGLQGMHLTDAPHSSSCPAYQGLRGLECETTVQKKTNQPMLEGEGSRETVWNAACSDVRFILLACVIPSFIIWFGNSAELVLNILHENTTEILLSLGWVTDLTEK